MNISTLCTVLLFQLAVVAKHFSVPFYVCAPVTSIDFNLPNGCLIPIEERASDEMTCVAGKRLAAPGLFSITSLYIMFNGLFSYSNRILGCNLI